MEEKMVPIEFKKKIENKYKKAFAHVLAYIALL